ncbi:MAG: DUF2156 domain-containing protein [Propionibacteriaceae bacterium]|nr:DUF2156 domain-containing protein [Propionibacteriaceae bacterium]
MNRRRLIRRVLVNLALVAALLLAVAMFASTIWHTPWGSDLTVRHAMAVNHFCRRYFALLLVLVAWFLFNRRFAAWLIAVVALSAGFVLYAPHMDELTVVMIGLQVFALVVLLVNRRYFCRGADHPSLRVAVVVFVALVLFFALDAVVGHLLARPELTWGQSFGQVLNMLFVTGGTRLVSRFAVVVFWLIFGVGVVLVLRPVVFRTVMSVRRRQRAREIVLADGQNPTSYLALEDDKALFFSENVTGVVAYRIVGDYIVVMGDPICAPDDFAAVLREFYLFCSEGDYTAVFLATTERYLAKYKAMGFDHIKCGEEAIFELASFDLAGGARAKFRSKFNGATNAGVTVHEYKPGEARDLSTDWAFESVSADWLKGKKSGQLMFTIGGLNLHNPMDRRYFYARDRDGQIVGFNVFLPYEGGSSYLVDMTRRLRHAPAGVTEKINGEAFLQFKAEGKHLASLGVAPLSNLGGDAEHPLADRALGLIYEKGNRFYGFKALNKAKAKYGPSWVPAYWVYPAGTLTPGMIMAIIKVQNPGGIRDFLGGVVKPGQVNLSHHE